MKKFYGTKPLEDIEAAVKANDWMWDDQAFNRGSDYVTFQFSYGGFDEAVVYNTFNGTFIVRLVGDILVTEKDDYLDDTDWYAALLDFIYITDAPAQKAGAA